MPDTTAIIVVDHGSKRSESNAMLEEFVQRFREFTSYRIVEPAHMELAQPTISQAFDRCVAQGATRVVVMPYFLLPGRHWSADIPSLTAAAAAKHVGVEFLVTAPIGLHPLMRDIVQSRIDHCLKHATGEVGPCDLCEGLEKGCELRSTH
ncbi:MAG: CbiX/SirB N-terminal domain-containing protein [Phycisphaeraceae bacterium]